MTTYNLTVDTPDDPRLLTLLAAWEYRGQGIPTIPVSLKTKRPVIRWKRFQDSLPTDDELVEFFGKVHRNIGIVTGSFSKLVVVDVDNQAGLRWVGENLPPTNVRVRTGSGGQHFYFRHPGGHVKTSARVTGDPGIGVDIRADGGFAVVPPSVHPNTR